MRYRSRPLSLLLISLALSWLEVIAITILALPASAAEQHSAGFQSITTAELGEMLEREDFEFVNVHVPYEGEIAQTDSFIPFDEIGANLDRLPADRQAKIVLYCRSGRMSELAAAELSKLGYTNVSHVIGGFVAWSDSGREILHMKNGNE